MTSGTCAKWARAWVTEEALPHAFSLHAVERVLKIRLECDGVGVRAGGVSDHGAGELRCCLGAAYAFDAKLNGREEGRQLLFDEAHRVVRCEFDESFADGDRADATIRLADRSEDAGEKALAGSTHVDAVAYVLDQHGESDFCLFAASRSQQLQR